MTLSNLIATSTPANGVLPISDGSGSPGASLDQWVSSGSGGSGDIQALLDTISTTHGAILFRGATDWEALEPGLPGSVLITNGSGADPAWGSATGYDTDAQNYFNAIAIAGSTISTSTKDAINDFVISAKALGLWSLFLDIGPLCGDDLTAALVKLKTASAGSSYTNVNFVGGDYTEATGLTGNGTNKYLRTGVLASALTSGDTGVGVYDRSTADSTNNLFGAASGVGSSRFAFYPPASDNVLYSDMYNSANELNGGSISGAIGFLFSTRISSPLHSIYRNGVSVASTATVGGTLPSEEIDFFAINAAGVHTPTSAHTFGFLCITQGMNATQAGNFYSIVQTLQSALGRSV